MSGLEKIVTASVLRVEKEIGGRILSLETGKIARQADGAVVVRYADTVVLVTAQSAPAREGIDWFPLFVDYREKFQAAGKIPGGRFYKREGRPTLKETLTMRMIDRPIRPLFPDGYKDEVQVIAWVFSADGENDPDTLSMIGATAALCTSSIPFETPLGVVRVGRVNGEFVLNPTTSQLDESDIDLVLAANGDDVVMIEADASEVSEADMHAAIQFGRRGAKDVRELVASLRDQRAAVKQQVAEDETTPKVADFVRSGFSSKIAAALDTRGKAERSLALGSLREEAGQAAVEQGLIQDPPDVRGGFDEVMKDIVRARIAQGSRSDGRAPGELRPINCEVGILPRTHGSAIFTRGETQVVATVTLGTGMDEEMVEGLIEDFSRTFMLHYNFPPFSVGEVKPVRGPSRRDIGHGALAEKAIKRVIPQEEAFPYTIRVVSDVTESNGSSSMATVCGATLSLMDAGVSILRPVAGISIGLISHEGTDVLLTDIQGEEDHYGDMDFKVAGTQNGITAVQLDIKVAGLKDEIISSALDQGREARLSILRGMLSVIDRPRPALSVYAPKLVQIKINPEKIGMVIGSGGKVVRKLQEETGTTIELEDDGTVTISGTDAEGIEKAKQTVLSITEEPEVGKIYTGRVRGIKDFGAFIEILPGTEGLLHISELSEEYVAKVTDHVRMGDEVTVKCIDVDDNGKIRLSRKAALKEEKKADG